MALLALLMVGCRFEDYSHQLQSANHMLLLGRLVHGQWAAEGPLTEEEIRRFADCEGLAYDRWGHQVEVYVAADSWVLAYPGRDGELDVEDLGQYAGKGSVDIEGLYDHDLVFTSEGYLRTVASKDVSEGTYKKGPLVPGEP